MEQTNLGVAHFLAEADMVARVLLTILAAMSVMTWYLIVTKGIAYWRLRGYTRGFLERFREAMDIGQIGVSLPEAGGSDPLSRIMHRGLLAAEQFRNRTGDRLVESSPADDILSRALRGAIEQETSRLEYGLTTLASIASSAPFVGLFGTVWAIYHALIRIGASGFDTIDRVAGPVGEALIMTALGLAVAVPALLAYNTFNRVNRVLLAEIDGFGHDLFTYMLTGVRADRRDSGRERWAVMAGKT